MKKCGIYCIHNIVNGKRYIGQSVDVMAREGNHFTQLCKGNHYNTYLQRSFIKYGGFAFEFCILEEVPEDMLDLRERSWIAYYRSTLEDYGYNSESGGSLNKHVSVETRAKISAAGKGRVHSAETRAKISAAHRGKIQGPPSEAHRAKLSAAGKGKVLSAEHRNKISEARKGMVFSAEHCAKISEAHKGKVLSAGARAKLSKLWKGKPRSAEIRAKISAAHKGKIQGPPSEDVRKKTSATLKLYWAKKRAAILNVELEQ